MARFSDEMINRIKREKDKSIFFYNLLIGKKSTMKSFKNLGVIGAGIGISVGLILAVLAVLQGATSGGELGMSLAIIAAIFGVSLACLGVFLNNYHHS